MRHRKWLWLVAASAVFLALVPSQSAFAAGFTAGARVTVTNDSDADIQVYIQSHDKPGTTTVLSRGKRDRQYGECRDIRYICSDVSGWVKVRGKQTYFDVTDPFIGSAYIKINSGSRIHLLEGETVVKSTNDYDWIITRHPDLDAGKASGRGLFGGTVPTEGLVFIAELEIKVRR